jgi:hypothetical protein
LRELLKMLIFNFSQRDLRRKIYQENGAFGSSMIPLLSSMGN